jgi:hypothetical protein
MKRTVALAALLSAAAGASGGAQAQEELRASRFDLGLYVGGAYTTRWFDSRAVTVSNGVVTENDDEEGFRPAYSPLAGLEVAYWPWPAIGVRAHGAYIPMRIPRHGGGFFGDNAWDRSSYPLNTWVYDLEVIARPWVAKAGVSGWLRTVYFWAGGGGLTVNVAGNGNGDARCEPVQLALGACLPLDPGDATVGQGTLGTGMDLWRFRLGSEAALFGELGVHFYDSPVHVGDGWVPRVVLPNGGTARVADDRGAATTRLVIGLRWMFGNQLQPPEMELPAPPPPMQVPPPVEETRPIRVCVIDNGQLREVPALYNVSRGDTTVNGQPFSSAYPATAGYAAGASWFVNSAPVTVGSQRYVKFGLPRVVGVSDVTRMGEYQGVGIFAEPGAPALPDIVYIPVRPGCEFQPYQKEVKVRNVRG